MNHTTAAMVVRFVNVVTDPDLPSTNETRRYQALTAHWWGQWVSGSDTDIATPQVGDDKP